MHLISDSITQNCILMMTEQRPDKLKSWEQDAQKRVDESRFHNNINLWENVSKQTHGTRKSRSIFTYTKVAKVKIVIG